MKSLKTGTNINTLIKSVTGWFCVYFIWPPAKPLMAQGRCVHIAIKHTYMHWLSFADDGLISAWRVNVQQVVRLYYPSPHQQPTNLWFRLLATAPETRPQIMLCSTRGISDASGRRCINFRDMRLYTWLSIFYHRWDHKLRSWGG